MEIGCGGLLAAAVAVLLIIRAALDSADSKRAGRENGDGA